MTMLLVQALRKNFGGVAAVDGVSFSVAAGELVALIGPNGAGKSTCFNLLNGQIQPDAGQVQMNGRDITALPPAARAHAGMARSFQVAAIFVSMTVRENVQTAIAARLGKIWNIWRDAARQHRAEADQLLADVGGKVSKLYNAMGLIMSKRVTYLINDDGKIVEIFPDVTITDHSKAVLKALQTIATNSATH